MVGSVMLVMMASFSSRRRWQRPRLPSLSIRGVASFPSRLRWKRPRLPLPRALVGGKQRSLSSPAAARPLFVQQRPRLPIETALGATAAMSVLGTVGLCRGGGFGLGDAAWLVATTATTTGFGDVVPKTNADRLICCAVATSGMGLVGSLAARVVEEWIQANTTSGDRAPARPSRARSAAILAFLAAALLAVGALGLRKFEGLDWGDALYLSVIIATSTGYGDVVPARPRARAFAALFSLGSALTFSTIVGKLAVAPLERARERERQRVLDAYGDALTPATLRELARGRLVTALGLSRNASNISRDERLRRAETERVTNVGRGREARETDGRAFRRFTMLTLVQQGLVTCDDLDRARARFDDLDVDASGFLHQADLDLLQNATRSEVPP